MKILSVEADAHNAARLRRLLVASSHELRNVTSAEEGLACSVEERWDMILHRVRAADGNGTMLLKRLREEARIETPIIVLGPDSPHLAAKCLDAGADNYQPMPFIGPELLSRMHAVHRRAGMQPPTIYRAGTLVVESLKKEVSIAGEIIRFPRCEYCTLELLAKKKNHEVPRRALAALPGHAIFSVTNGIEVTIGRIRKRLAPHVDGSFALQTVRGYGYVLREC